MTEFAPHSNLCKGPFLNAVTQIFHILDSLPLSHVPFTQPIVTFWTTPFPSSAWRHLWMVPNKLNCTALPNGRSLIIKRDDGVE